MNIGVLGTGVVGNAIATALANKGHHVRMGSRSATNEKAADWVKQNGKQASQGDFADASMFGEILFICLGGDHALNVIKTLSNDAVQNKIIIDVSNPLDFSKGMPPTIIEGMGNTNSLGEEIQKALPSALVVKALNTINFKVIVNANEVAGGDHNLFICGNNGDAKNTVKQLLADNFNWRKENIIDLGGIEKARVTEGIVPFWLSVMQVMDSPVFNFKIAH